MIVVQRVETLERLSPREIEVLVAVGRTETFRDAARLLYLSESTVKTHMQAVRWRLRVSSTSRALVVALQHGYITLEELI